MHFRIFKFFVSSALYLFLFLDVSFCANNFLQVDICRETPGNDTKPFCTCKDQVISCDFSSFKSNEKYDIELNGWNDNLNGNIRRLCLCGGPSTLRLMLSPNILNGLRQLHRVDLYNIPGVVHTRQAFAKYFSGDLYISDVRINTIHPLSFAGGDPFTIRDVSDLKCCSKIKPPLKHLNHPVFYMEEAKIGKVESNGIHNAHKWKTVVWSHVLFKEIDNNGVLFETPGMNVSIQGCTFNRTKQDAIAIKDAANVLLSMNTFTSNSDFHAFWSRSANPNSNVVLLENFFNNGQVLDVDASKVLGLFNSFSLWDNITFYHLNHTHFQNRIYLMSLNSIREVKHFDSTSIPPGSSQEIRYFYENVLGHCDCNESTIQFPAILLDSRCEYKTSLTVCNPTIEKAVQTCQTRGSVFRADCVSDQKLTSLQIDYMILLKEFLVKHSSHLDSPFVEEMLKFSPYLYEVPLLDQHELDFQTGEKNSSNNISAGLSVLDRLILLLMIYMIKVILA